MHTAKTSVSIIKARPFTFASSIGERAENLRYMHWLDAHLSIVVTTLSSSNSPDGSLKDLCRVIELALGGAKRWHKAQHRAPPPHAAQ
jgi:hypothetical protein